MKHHVLYSLADQKDRERFFNVLQQSARPSSKSNGFSISGHGDTKNGAIGYHAHHVNLHDNNQLCTAPSAATLQQLKRLLIENAEELKKCKNDLLEKNNEIERLKEENETLKTRVERMERRLNLQKAPTPPPTFSFQAPAHFVTVIAQESQVLENPLVKKCRSRSVSSASNTSRLKRPKIEKVNNSKPNSLRNQCRRQPSCSSSSAYLNEIKTPVWRVVPYSSSFALEGTENITDDAFLKRHQKCETEEKRIVRRDKARQRELELLQRKQGVQESGETPFDDSELIEAVEVVSKLPPRSKITVKQTCNRRPK